jgi:hypothetical protein
MSKMRPVSVLIQMHRVLVQRGPIRGQVVSHGVDALNLAGQRAPSSSQVMQARLYHLLVHCDLSHVLAPIGLPSAVESICHGEVTYPTPDDEKRPSEIGGSHTDGLPDERSDLVRPVSVHREVNG